MNAKQLCNKQKYLDERINQQAEKCGLVTDDIYPIRDGIADEEGYLSSSLKVAWVLKEPYDDFDPNGQPCGGGWSLPKDCFKKADAWRNQVWQKIAYVMYGFRNQVTWFEMPWIRDQHEMMNELLTIAWVNASKMPAQKSSKDTQVANQFNAYWKDVVLKQLEIYDPDVIVFGKTFHFMQKYFPEAEYVEDLSSATVNYYRWSGKILLDTGHPGRKGQKYVDGLIAALHAAKKEIAKLS